jgi:threonine/homoserine/homoserine lactone efflux protein
MNTTLIGFALVSFVMVCTPGPNMIYLVSRSVTQGPRAGLTSLIGVGLGFVFYLTCTIYGLAAMVRTVPAAYETIRWAGVIYLFYLAGTALFGRATPFHLSSQPSPAASSWELILMGFLTNALNPKAAVLYLAILPQFTDVSAGNVAGQMMALGGTQIAISLSVNATIIISAGTIARWFQSSPFRVKLQRWLLGSVLGMLACKMAMEKRAV